MQPYFFPYIGYFQLIHSVDAFVIYDDVNYIKRGWINRNNIILQGKPKRLTLELEGASQNKLINAINVSDRKFKLLVQLHHCYSKAPFFKQVFPLCEEILLHESHNLANFLDYQLRTICQFLGINRHWYISSQLKKDARLRGQEKIIAICKELGATHYINPEGGSHLYSQSRFEEHMIGLQFLKSVPKRYQQFGTEFLPALSIIDVMMFNSQDDVREKVSTEYCLHGSRD